MIQGGYCNRVLRVNLTEGTWSTEPLPEEGVLRKYVGGFGLGLWYLMRELPPGAGPLDPENPLIFMNGPLTGTRVPAPTNCTVTTLNGDTGFTAGRAHGHGWFGPYMKMAGYDGIIITGASDKWLYLWINDDTVELRDASQLLGKDTHETEDLVKQELGYPIECGKGVSVAAIGPAGEHLVAGSLIEQDKNHSFAHSGVGQVMGSKKLKAIAIRGTHEVPVFDEEKVKSVRKEWAAGLKDKGVAPVIYQAGAHKLYDSPVWHDLIGLSAKNWTQNWLPGFGKGLVTSNENTVRPCFRCPIGCSSDSLVKEGPYKGYVATLSGGGENMEGAASILGVSDDPGAVVYLTDLDDRLGFETSTVGCSMAVAFEAYEKGLLTTEDTDGLELKWGDAEVIETLVRRIANQEGDFAKMLGDGPKVAAERVGLPDAAVHIKGSGMNLHDWRRAWGVLCGQIVSGGSGWPAPGADKWTSEPDAGYPEKPPCLSPKGKGVEVARTAGLKFWNDCNGTCWFATWGQPNIKRITSEAIANVVGWTDFSSDETVEVGYRVLNLERIFNMMRGLTVDDDLNVSPRLTEPAPADAMEAAGLSIAPYLEGWVRDYYQENGWDRKTGKPLRSTLTKLGLEEYIDKLWAQPVG
jgi:aldehyde:ferredoxin oxidoreductase